MRRDAMLIPLYLWVSLSLLIHFWGAVGTRAVADRLGERERAGLNSPLSGGVPASEVDIDFTPPPEPVVPPPPTHSSVQGHPQPIHHEREREHPEHHTTVAQPPPTPLHILPPTPEAARPPPPRVQHAPFVDQENPNHEDTVTDPHFLAQANRHVDEETQAQVRNLDRNDPHPRLGGTPRHSSTQAQGNADHDVHADLREVHGDHSIVPHEDPHAARQRPPASAMTAIHPPSSNAGDTRRAGNDRTVGREGTIGLGVVPVLTAPGGTASSGAAPTTGQAGQAGQNGAGGEHGGGAERVGIHGFGATRALAALTPTMSTYEAVFGPQEIERQRQVAAQERSAARGSYEDDWAQTRSAIENFTPNVRVGNQTALRTAASPFAAYITAMHRRIHRIFADGYLASLTGLPNSSPLNDQTLEVTLEISLERNGTLHRLGVVRTSGVLPFDVAAVSAVRHAAPFGDAPEAILSGDGRVYVHWAFHRDGRQCHPGWAEPYILPNPGGTSPSPTQHPDTHPAGPEETPRGGGDGPASVGATDGRRRLPEA